MIPVDHKRLLNAADKLVSIEGAIDKCDECGVGNWCLKHAQEHGEAMCELRAAIGRTPTEK